MGKWRYRVIRGWCKVPFAYHPSSVAVDEQDRVYVSEDQDARGDSGKIESADTPLIRVYDRDGNLINHWGTGAVIHSHGLVVAGGVLYVCDKDASKGLMYTLDGKILRVIGEHMVHSDTGAVDKGDPVPHPAGP